MKFLLALLLPVLWLGSPAKADDAKTIAQRVDDSWIAAYNKDDAAGVAALYASDAALLPQGTAQPIIGASKIREFLDGFMKQKVSNLVLPVTEARMLDARDLASRTEVEICDRCHSLKQKLLLSSLWKW